MKLPQQCPACRTSLRDYSVPHHYLKYRKLFTRAVAVTHEDGTCSWECPECHQTWERRQPVVAPPS